MALNIHRTYVLGPNGFTETFDNESCLTMVRLGLVVHYATVAKRGEEPYRYFASPDSEEAYRPYEIDSDGTYPHPEKLEQWTRNTWRSAL